MVHALKNKLVRSAVGLAIGLLCSMAAQAEANPYYLGASLGANRVTNVYSLPDTNNADTVATASLLAGVDQQIGRQHLVIDGSLQQNHYKVNTPLNNHGYSLHGQFDWSTVGNVSGTLSASANQSLASYNIGEGITQVFAKNIEKDHQLQSLVRVGLVTRYSLEASLTHYEQSFSLVQYDALAFSQNAGSLGLVYKPNDLLRLGVALRHTTGEYPRYPVVSTQFDPDVAPFFVKEADNFKRNDLDLTANWAPTGASKLDARLSWTKADHDVALALDFKGITGSVGWNWQPVSRLIIGSHYTRDTGNQNTALGIYLNRVGNAFQLDASYELTSKIGLTSSAVYNRGSYSNNGSNSSFDNIHTLSLGARWAYSRSLSMTCQLNRTGRSASTAAYNYSASGFGCTAQALMY